MELLTAKRVRSFSSFRREKVAEMIRAIFASSSSSVDLSKMFHALANDVVLGAAFGKSFREEERHLQTKLHTAMDETRILMSNFFFTDYSPEQLSWVFDGLIGRYARLKKTWAKIDSFLEKIIQEHLDRRNPEQEDFVNVMLRLNRDRHLTREEVKGLFMNILIGGTDTSTAVLEWAMTELMKNPAAMAKAQRELRTVVRGKHQVEEDNLPCFEFLNAVIKETMQLYPQAPLLIPRETTHPIDIAGYEIPPKTTVFVNAFAVGRDLEIWPDPEEFVPERFEKSPVDYRGRDFGLIPFGAGRRGCPGIDFGMTTLQLALANLLYCFDWELLEGMSMEELDSDESYGIVVKRKNPLRLVPGRAQIPPPMNAVPGIRVPLS
ncbi:hypothetical protein H6P81_009622 [Aristolochia fimbriata]|uniref:Cytochrome P450 n=1 Tax=Aristolochia fimbriata TaxID=158543 RepID=A0AAV7EPJ7_ARIFI|nr:hypothetical protein H6P81_009622 [Aristolochia fimbriata]